MSDGASYDLRLGDCRDPVSGMASLGGRSVDCVITDPPYSAHVHAKPRRGLTATNKGDSSQIHERRDLGFESLTTEAMEFAAGEFGRLARRWVLVFCDVESSHLWANALRAGGLEYLRTMAWVKLGGAPQFTGDRPAVGFEAIVVAHRPGRKRWNGGGKAGIYQVPTAIDRDRTGRDLRTHTAQKPLGLMEALVRDFSEPGDLILDPFAGSATTGVAARHLGRSFLGWERDATCYTAAMARLSVAIQQYELFAPKRGRSNS